MNAIGARIIVCDPQSLRLCSEPVPLSVESNLHSPERRLIELRIEHGDLDALIDNLANDPARDELMLRRLKKRRLALRDVIAQLELALDPKEPA